LTGILIRLQEGML